MSEKKIQTNGEILFLYDAEMCNPNGDPDNENRPRMDYTTSTNIVTDLRLKRYIRDYLEEYKNLGLYLTNPEGNVLNATDRLKFWKWRKGNPNVDFDMKEIKKEEVSNINENDLLNDFIDIRYFGATIPLKLDEQKGTSTTFTGPIQFNWGKSLNEVDLVESSSITTHLSSESGPHGSIGTDYRVYYSFIAFHGIISAKRSQYTNLSTNDITIFDEAILKSIPLLASRSKINQYPRFYLRIEYKCDDFFIGDLRKYIKLKQTKNLRSIKDVDIDLSELWTILLSNKEKVEKINMWIDTMLSHSKPLTELTEIIENITIPID